MNKQQILDVLLSKSTNKHYAGRYINFIFSRSNNKEIKYTENHHILPKANTQFPEYKSFKNYPWNKISLTPREHFIAHWLLWKSQGKYMAYAFSAMRRKSKVQTDRYYKINSKVYEQLKIDVAYAQSTRIISDETRNKMSIGQQNREKITCEHCNKICDPSNYKRWHGNNCKVFTGVDKHIVKQNHELISCPHCGAEGKTQGMLANHFDRCPKIFDRSIKEFFTCPHCERILPNTQNIKNLHYDNCSTFTGIPRIQSENSKLSNDRRGKPGIPKSKIKCPHCNKEGTKKRMLMNHFDNCELLTLPEINSTPHIIK